MNHNAGTVPFNYGDLFAITEGPTFWFQDKTGVIRGVKLIPDSGTFRLLIGEGEIVIKRAGAGESTRPGPRIMPNGAPAPAAVASSRPLINPLPSP